MAENPHISIASEALRHVQAGEFGEAADVLRHEGLKKAVEAELYHIARHEFGRNLLSHYVGGVDEYPLLRTNVAGLGLDGPVGIAPGWDKTGKTILAWQALGARHITVGGITPFQQLGNRMPRLRTMDHHVGDHGLGISLNSFGFWSPGADKVVYNIQKQRELGEVSIPIVAQVTLNKEFYEGGDLDLIGAMVGLTVRKVLPIADAISLGLSSPNTAGMREAQAAGSRGDQFLTRVVYAARQAVSQADRSMPIIVKGDGDGGEERLEMYCKWVEWREDAFDALELINTTALPHIKARYGVDQLPGGLAGADPEYQQMALDATRYVYQAVGDRTDIIATGGCNSSAQALKMLENGASAIGVNTVVRTLGLRAPRILENGLLDLLIKKYPQATRLDQIIGTDTTRGPKYLTRENVADKAANIARRVSQGVQSNRPPQPEA